MRRRLGLRASARRDIREAAAWYERERPGLGDEFLIELDAVLLRVADALLQLPPA
jgi:hypothetical protein